MFDNKLFNYTLEQIQLKSGARLLNVNIPNFPLSLISAFFEAGSRFDPIGKEGLAHFFEHLYTDRTQKYPDQKDRLRALESAGIFYNAMTNMAIARYFHIQLPTQTQDSLLLLLDGLNSSLIKKEDVENEKGIIIDEEARKRNNPQAHIWTIADRALWPESRLGRPVLGTKESIQLITLKDILDFEQKFYTPHNLVFVVIGQEDGASLKNFINKHYTLEKQRVNQPTPDTLGVPKKLVVEKRNTDTAVVAISFKTTSWNNRTDTIILDLIRGYLAVGWISKFVERLRIDNSLTYAIENYSYNYQDTGALQFSFSVKPEKTSQALEIVFKEIKSLKETLIDTKLLEHSKVSNLSRFIQNKISPQNLMYWYGSQALLTNEILSLNEYIERYNAITPQQIKEVAQKYLIENNLSVAMIGPIEEKDITIPSL